MLLHEGGFELHSRGLSNNLREQISIVIWSTFEKIWCLKKVLIKWPKWQFGAWSLAMLHRLTIYRHSTERQCQPGWQEPFLSLKWMISFFFLHIVISPAPIRRTIIFTLYIYPPNVLRASRLIIRRFKLISFYENSYWNVMVMARYINIKFFYIKFLPYEVEDNIPDNIPDLYFTRNMWWNKNIT